MPGLLERKVRILVPLLPARGRDGALLAAELASEIEWAKARLVKPDGYERAVAAAGRATPRPPAEVAAVSPRLRAREAQARSRRLRRPDHRAAPTSSNATPSSPPRNAGGSATSSSTSSRTPSAAQFRLLRAWLGDRSDLCVVGDPDQAIYGFAGADASYLAGFRRWFPPEQFPDVGFVPPRQQLPVDAPGGRGRRARCSVHRVGGVRRCTRPSPTVPCPTFTEYDTAEDEARGVARELRERRERAAPVVAHGGPLPRQRAVGALRRGAHRAGRPVPRARWRRFLDRPEVKVALDQLRTVRPRERPHRPFAEHLTDFADRRRETSPRSGASTSTRSCGSGTSTSRPTAAAAASTASSSSCRPRCAATTPATARATRSSCSRSTAPRASSSTPCSSPGSRQGLVPISHAKTTGGDGRGATAALRRAQPGRTRACT